MTHKKDPLAQGLIPSGGTEKLIGDFAIREIPEGRDAELGSAGSISIDSSA